HTHRVVILDEGEVAEITATTHLITDLDGTRIERPPLIVDWNAEAAEKGGFDHYFIKEIEEQPAAIERSLLGRVREGRGGYDLRMSDLDALAASGKLDLVRRVVILGCGSSIMAANVARYAMERWSRLPVEVSVASEFRYADPVVGPDTLIFSVTQSGETADTLEATKLARKAGAPVVGVTNVVGSAITRNSDAVLFLQAGPEISVTATKTFVTTTTVLTLAGLWLGQHTKRLADETLREVLAELHDVPNRMQRLLDTARGETDHYKATAAYLATRASCLFIGRGASYPLAAEGALKLKEISYVHAEAYAAGELKHGPIALLDETVPLIAIATRSATYEKVISNVQEVRARKARVIAIATQGDLAIREHADDIFFIPDAHEAVSPLLAIVPLQLVAYYTALARGTDVDQPRNLAKSVTVE
ncbi:MAG TPA: glutamine--fructose-6-phosphate transaminase (isomerizing), partial [Ktedonobacterales bacterium]